MYLGEKGETSRAVPSAGGRTSTFWLSWDYTKTSHAVFRFQSFFSVAGMPSGIQKRSHCCVPLFLTHGLQFTHEHLGAVLCPSCVWPGFESRLWGCMPTEPIQCLVPRVNVVSCDGRVSAPSPYIHVNIALKWDQTLSGDLLHKWQSLLKGLQEAPTFSISHSFLEGATCWFHTCRPCETAKQSVVKHY